MKYSGFIDSILAEAAFAKKANDASWLIGRLQTETDPIKRKLLSVVCNADFIKGVKRDAEWLREQKGKLEDLAAGIEDGIEDIEAEEVNDHMQSVNRQLAMAAYDDDEDDDYDWDDEDEDSEEGFDFGDEETTIYEVQCICGEVINFDEETLEKGSITCPNCGENLEFSLEDDDEE